MAIGSRLTRHGLRSELATHVGFNGLAQVAPMIVTLAITPFLLDRLGLDRFGVWALALVVMGTLTALDGGISASLARYFAIYAARDDRVETGRLLVGALVFSVVFGGVLTALAWPVAPTAVELLDIPAGLDDEAVFVLRCLPALAALGLAADSTTALLQGNGRFRALAISMFGSSGVFAVAVIVLVQPGASLRPLMVATALRYLVLLLVGLFSAAPHVVVRRPLLPSLETTRDLGRFASRMQLSALTGFVNSELDVLVIAAVLPVRYVGLYAIGLQAASAARSLPLYVFAPVLTRLAATFRRDGRTAAVAEFERFERTWFPTVLAYGIVAVSAIGFAVPIWLGDRYELSGAVAALLLFGFIVHVALTGMRTCYVRAIGEPGLEARYSFVWMVGNALLTVPLALAFGVLGVVASTVISGVVASVYFVFLCREREGLRTIVPGRRWWLLGVAGAAATVAGELAVASTGLHGFGALALAALPPLVALSFYAMGLRPSWRPTPA